jgi:hypothetical protein
MRASDTRSSQFQIGLIALREPTSQYGAVAAATALVAFEEALPAHAPETHQRVFAAAARAFRNFGQLNEWDVQIREASFVQPVLEAPKAESSADLSLPGARVWLLAANYE